MNEYNYYSELIKPFFAPPSWIFSPVWTILYLLILISFSYIFFLYFKKRVNFIFVLPFILNIIFNIFFTPLLFGLNNLFLASVDILLVLITLIWFIKISFSRYRWVSIINIPYLIWVSFATVLQISILFLNL